MLNVQETMIHEKNINEEMYKPCHSIRDVSQVKFGDEVKTSDFYQSHYSRDHWAKATTKTLVKYGIWKNL